MYVLIFPLTMHEYQILMMDILKHLMVVFVNYFSRKLKKGIANRSSKRKKKRGEKKQKTPSKSLRSYCSTWPRKYYIPSLYEKFESFNQSVATLPEFPLCVLWYRGRVSFTLDTIYEIWQWKFSKVIEFRFKSCFLHYWLSASAILSFLHLVSSFAKKGWHPCSAMTVFV